MNKKTLSSIALLCLHSLVLTSLPAAVTFVDDDFDDGDLGLTIPGVGTPPVNANSVDLASLALLLGVNHQARWDVEGTNASTYYLSFDIHALPSSILTIFFDRPSAVRTDLHLIGTHGVEVFYDVALQQATIWVDGIVQPSSVTSLWRPGPSVPTSFRISNPSAPLPTGAFSEAAFYIDNVLIADERPIPEPSALLLLLMAFGIKLTSHRRPRS